MPDAIGSLPGPSGPAYAQQASSTGATGGASASPQGAETDAVTLSDAAAGAGHLVSAAQASDGVDEAAVAQIKNALAAGTYSVEPEDLAKAIATVLKGTR